MKRASSRNLATLLGAGEGHYSSVLSIRLLRLAVTVPLTAFLLWFAILMSRGIEHAFGFGLMSQAFAAVFFIGGAVYILVTLAWIFGPRGSRFPWIRPN